MKRRFTPDSRPQLPGVMSKESGTGPYALLLVQDNDEAPSLLLLLDDESALPTATAKSTSPSEGATDTTPMNTPGDAP